MGYFRRQMTVVEIIVAELHCLSNSGHRVDCSASYVRDGRGALSETVATVSLRTKRMRSVFRLRNKKMFRDRTEPTLFRAGTVPETVPVRSLAAAVTAVITVNHKMYSAAYNTGQRCWTEWNDIKYNTIKITEKLTEVILWLKVMSYAESSHSRSHWLLYTKNSTNNQPVCILNV